MPSQALLLAKLNARRDQMLRQPAESDPLVKVTNLNFTALKHEVASAIDQHGK